MKLQKTALAFVTILSTGCATQTTEQIQPFGKPCVSECNIITPAQIDKVLNDTTHILLQERFDVDMNCVFWKTGKFMCHTFRRDQPAVVLLGDGYAGKVKFMGVQTYLDHFHTPPSIKVTDLQHFYIAECIIFRNGTFGCSPIRTDTGWAAGPKIQGNYRTETVRITYAK